MNLHESLQYPLVKFLLEEFNGSFYENELTYLSRMLILYHNRYVFSFSENMEDYIDDCVKYLREPPGYWYLNPAKRARARLIQTRMGFALKNNPGIFKALLCRKDYSSIEARQQAVQAIYDWLQTDPGQINARQWRMELLTNFGR